MTLTHCLKMLIRCASGTDQNILSVKLESSKLVLDDCANWIDWLSADGVIDRSEWEIQATRITYLPNRCTILALPATPTALRGKKGDTLIDEAAWVPNLGAVLDSAKPLAIWGGKISLISSVFPVPNLFTELSSSGDWDVLEVPLDRAVDLGLYKRIRSVAGLPEPTDQESQSWIAGLVADAGRSADHEYFCRESSSGGSWITEDTELRDLPIIYPKHSIAKSWITEYHSIGVDVGGSGTITAIVAASSSGIVGVWELLGWNQIQVADLIQNLITEYTTDIAIDTNGIGLGLADILENRGIRIRRTPNRSEWFRSTCLAYLTDLSAGRFAGIRDPSFLQDHASAEITKGSVSLRKVGDRHCELVTATAMAYQFKPNTDPVDSIWD
jgi:hypothetical protein